ncbi:hypothetical protein KJ853_02155 [Patescibacteria group bacterium]|nr:hypothetical protein [Patescibacteria group bacterium]
MSKKGPLELAREALEEIWQDAELRGRAWGRKKKDGGHNPFYGSHILVARGDELVILSSKDGKRYGEVVIHQFKKVPATFLWQEIKNTLLKKNIPLA